MVAGNTIDVGTRNAEIVQLTVVESGKLTNGLLVGAHFLKVLRMSIEVSFSFTAIFSAVPQMSRRIGQRAMRHCAGLYGAFTMFIKRLPSKQWPPARGTGGHP